MEPRKVTAKIMVVEEGGSIVFEKGGVPKKEDQEATLIGFDATNARVIVSGRPHTIPVTDLVGFDVAKELEALEVKRIEKEAAENPPHPATGKKVMAKMVIYEDDKPVMEGGQFKYAEQEVLVNSVTGDKAEVINPAGKVCIIPVEALILPEGVAPKQQAIVDPPKNLGEMSKKELQELLTQKNISFKDTWPIRALVHTLLQGQPPLDVLTKPELQALAKEMEAEFSEESTNADLIAAIRAKRLFNLSDAELLATAEKLSVEKAAEMPKDQLVEEIMFAEDAAEEEKGS